MPSLPRASSSFQTRSTYLIISEFMNIIQKGKSIFLKNFSFSRTLPVVYTLFFGKLIVFFFIKNKVIPVRIIKSWNNDISFFFVSNSGSKISIFQKDKIMTLIKISSKKNFLAHIDNHSFCFRKFHGYNFQPYEIKHTDPICFSAEENHLVVSSHTRRFIVFDLNRNTIFSFIPNGSIKEIRFQDDYSFSHKLFGKINEGDFFNYDLKKKTLNLLKGTGKFIFGKTFFILRDDRSISFFCRCHRKLLTRIFLPHNPENFILINQNKFFYLMKKQLYNIRIGSGEVRPFVSHTFISQNYEVFSDNFLKIKIFKREKLNFFMADLFGEKNFHYIKPLSEKNHSLVFFNSSISYNKRTNDLKFFGKGTSIVLASDSNTIRVFSGPFFKFLGEFFFGNSNFLTIQIRGSALIGINSKGQLVFGSLVSFEIIEWFQLHNTSVGVFSLNKEIDKKGIIVSGKKKFVKFWTLEQKKFSKIKIKLISFNHSFSGKMNAVSISSNAEIAAFASNKKEIFISNYPFRDSLKILENQKKAAWALDFSRGGKMLVIGFGDGSIVLFSISYGLCLKKFEGDGYPIYTCFFNLENSHIFSTNSEGKLRIWKTDKGSCAVTIKSSGDSLWACDLSYTEDFLITGCGKGTIVILKDFSSKISRKKKSNFSFFIALQKNFDAKKSRKNFKKIVQKILEYRDPILFLDLIKYFSTTNSSKFWEFFSDFIHSSSISILRFVFRSMVFWNTNKNGIIWTQKLLDLIFKKVNLFLFPKLDIRVIEALIWMNQQWLIKMRDYNGFF